MYVCVCGCMSYPDAPNEIRVSRSDSGPDGLGVPF